MADISFELTESSITFTAPAEPITVRILRRIADIERTQGRSAALKAVDAVLEMMELLEEE